MAVLKTNLTTMEAFAKTFWQRKVKRKTTDKYLIDSYRSIVNIEMQHELKGTTFIFPFGIVIKQS